ncbi:uncharacterized protein C8A04DRAFT_30881 [Dichotomopilus funicola]|uniref:Uncharacterized protein n=1 Tax=Dichotomopilus funicola TaxID=1934379 RepID=A0AAN6UYD9_9PEZI|nr:hypothetical protein C8A04DRAFT_30881 [Dichotomopilus funicola]
MKFFVPFLFAGVALASRYTLSVDLIEAMSPGEGTAKMLPRDNGVPSVGFTTCDLDLAVISLDEHGFFNNGFVIRLLERDRWALIRDPAYAGDITGPFTVDDITGDFIYLDDAKGHPGGRFCDPAERDHGADEELDIYLYHQETLVHYCLGPGYKLTAKPYTGADP